MILANKFHVKSLKEFKVPAKVYLNGVLTYVEKDLTNRVGEFDSLIESVDFKKMEKEDLTKMYSKKKWLQKSSTFLNIIIMKDIDSDGSKSGSDKSSSEKSEEEEEEDEEEGGGIPKFDVKKSAKNVFKFSKKNRECTTTTYSSWAANAVGTKATKYGLKLGTGCTDLMIGFALKTLNVNQSNYTVCGWYFYTNGGVLYSQAGDSGRSYGSSDYNSGTIYSLELNVKKGTITVYKYATSLGLAFTITDKKNIKPLIPNINTYNTGSVFEFVKFKAKK